MICVDPLDVVKALERFYIHFVNPSNIASVYNIPSQHAIVYILYIVLIYIIYL